MKKNCTYSTTGLNIACWNVRNMLESCESNCPQSRSVLIAHELSRLNIDIAALSEVRLPDEGNLKEQGAEYTLYWSGKPSTERHLSGVGFMVRTSIASKLESLPTGHSDWIISMRLLLKNQQHVTLFSTYQPFRQILLIKIDFILISQTPSWHPSWWQSHSPRRFQC